ncbi:CPBP family intramembrane glutamic endopeptidase [Risungbinella massiliensis]|uniref:CPBP family intramembrane glutamic endopeptidase n=1 Tax=Risungbinella massiliensis TaxID=1329796 RepID=UPI0005CC7A58|nr:type II CAAX endopeptidase family protein [Risungbinella massiliensis]
MNDIVQSILSQLIMMAPFAYLFICLNKAEKYRLNGQHYGELANLESEEIQVTNYKALAKENKSKAKTIISIAIGIIAFLYLLSSIVGLYAQQSNFLSDMFPAFSPNGGLGIWIPSMIGLLLLIPIIRKQLSKWVPIDPQNSLHTVSLSLSMLIFIQLFVSMSIGLEDSMIGLPDQTALQAIVDLWTQNILLAFLAFFGVGWLTRRSGKELLDRLGLVLPSGKSVLIGMIVGLLFVGVAVGLEFAFTQFGIGSDPEVNRATEQLLGPLFTSFFGVLTLGLAAALGEELIFRGALLPRFGIFLTSILFTFLHTQYGFSVATLIVFILAIVLAYLRQRYNTSVTMIVHATYNIALGLLTYFQI